MVADESKVVQRLRHLRYQARRAAQTPRVFRNWPTVLAGMLLRGMRRGTGDLVFVTRSGLTLETPNVPGARLPVYEMFAEDTYGLGWFLREFGHQPMHAIDVGAHIGTFACQLTEMNDKATVQCFEPSPSTARYLRRNLEHNRLSGRVTVTEAAVAGVAGSLEFVDWGSGHIWNGLASTASHLGVRTTRVAAVTFDSIVASAPRPVRLVKIDCEGAEYDLVCASSPRSWSDVQRVVMEYQPVPGRTFGELRDFLKGAGLALERHRPSAHVDGLGLAWFSR